MVFTATHNSRDGQFREEWTRNHLVHSSHIAHTFLLWQLKLLSLSSTTKTTTTQKDRASSLIYKARLICHQHFTMNFEFCFVHLHLFVLLFVKTKRIEIMVKIINKCLLCGVN